MEKLPQPNFQFISIKKKKGGGIIFAQRALFVKVLFFLQFHTEIMWMIECLSVSMNLINKGGRKRLSYSLCVYVRLYVCLCVYVCVCVCACVCVSVCFTRAMGIFKG